MQREIGSNFWLSPECSFSPCSRLHFPEYGERDLVLLSSGRLAIRLALREISLRNPGLRKVALIPAFTCETVLEPFLSAGYTVHTLPMDDSFSTSGEELEQAVNAVGASVVLLHRYFGFDTLAGCGPAIEQLRKNSVCFIEDRTQSLYSGFPLLPVDFWVGSLRKWAGLPDGGFAVCREGRWSERPEEPCAELETAKLEASYAKYRYLFEGTGEKAAFLELYRKAEAILDAQDCFYAMAPASRAVQASLDISELKRRRRENYQTAVKALKGCSGVRPAFDSLPEDAVPLYLPLWVQGDRKQLQSHLAAASIYAPIIWPRPAGLPSVCREADNAYEHLLCLPIDQRYDRADMERMSFRVRTGSGEQAIPPDVYYLASWRDLYAQRDGVKTDCYTFHHPDGTVLYPYVLRQTPPAEDGETYYDIITPYGFNGPCIVDRKREDLTALAAAFDEDFSRYCKERHIIAEYVRFSPWLKNADVFGPLYTLRDNGQTVAIDLTVDDIFRDEISSKRRNLIRTARKKGVVVEFDETGETVEEFYRLYQNTIQKNEIGSYYQFPLSFLQEHFRALGSHVCIANARVDGKTISASFLLQCGDHMHYHLSANDYTMTAYQGNSLLLYEAAKRGKAFGCKYLHLGGVGTAEPTLMHFKLSFTHHGGMPFFVGSRVRNPQIFEELSAKYGTGRPGYFPPYRG